MIGSALLNKTLLPVWLLSLLPVCWDASTRLTGEEVEQNRQWQFKPLQQVEPKFSYRQAEQILTQLNKYDKVVQNPVAEPVAVSTDDQSEQQGDLEQLDIGNIRYRLSGVFSSNGHFAVLQRTDISDNTQEMIKVQVGDTLKNYQLYQILANKVLFAAKDGRQISLNLFIPEN